MNNLTAAPPKIADRIVQELDGEDFHRLVINGVPGDWFPPTEIAFNGVYYATLRIQGHANLPQVFSVIEEPFDTLPATEDIGGDPK